MAIRPLDRVVIHEMPLFAEHIEPSHTRNPHITMLNSKNVLITGGTGSFGKSVHKTYSGEIQSKIITIMSRDEMKQWSVAEKYWGRFNPWRSVSRNQIWVKDVSQSNNEV